MKKISFIGIFLIIFVFISSAQGVYSKENLEKGTLVGLNLNLKKAQNLKSAGVFLCIAGPVFTLGGMALAATTFSTGGSSDEFGGGTIMFLGGIITTLVGLPILITGSTRVKRVKAAINNHPVSGFYIAPGFMYLSASQNIYPALTLKARF